MNQDIEKLHEKEVLKETDHSPDEFLSTVFLRPQLDGTY